MNPRGTASAPLTRGPRSSYVRGVLGIALVGSLALSGCAAEGLVPGASAGVGTQAPTPTSSASSLSEAVVMVAPGDPTIPARPDEPITVQVADGRLTSVAVTSSNGEELAGTLAADGARWTSSDDLLAFGARYAVVAEAVDARGVPTRTATRVQVATPALVTPSVGVSEGAVVGVGMPVIVRLDRAPENRAEVERRLEVTTTPVVRGAWSWVSDREVHYRPQNYWPSGTSITVSADLDGVRLGDQQWGSGAVERSYRVGSANIYRVDVANHQMEVIIDGQAVGTIPITTGKPGFITRNGVKVIMSKERSRRMRSETVGIAQNSSEGYDLTVDYAMRLTNSGEFIHAAPWSVRQQGRANVSHGCTGMSTANARWLYERSKPGDVVEYVGSPRPMTISNGWGDWNASWDTWVAGSAL